MISSDLIDGDPDFDIRSSSLACLSAGEEGGISSSMIASPPIAIGAGFVVLKAAEHLNVLLNWCQWFQCLR